MAPGTATPGSEGPQVPSIPNLKDRIPKLEPRRRRQPSNALPVPETPALPPPPSASTLSFKVPSRRILSTRDHDLFLSSPTYDLIVSWVFSLSESVVDTPISAVADDDISEPVKSLLAILDEAETLCKDSPPDDQAGSRFGNKTFRLFLDKVKQCAPAWHDRLGVSNPDAVAELSTYLNHSFGNRSRIDYGSGHELNFVIWLLCLYRLSVVGRPDFRALVLRVFARYLEVMRLVQSTYYLEPAGSHGVWGLDDYQFLPFLFGASQLLHHPFITPLAIHQQLTLEEFGDDYLYLGQVVFVNSTKTVRGLRWHSPMLDDISSAKGWGKVEGGMRRMFAAEVLRKLPVMQHFLFGSLVPAADGMSEHNPANVNAADADAPAADESDSDEDGDVDVFDRDGVRHVHRPKGWGDCCGIKVPSSIAAAEEMRKRGGGQLRRIPFD
ncbi:serine/threonine-protein phosphatase 2A activator 2 [Phialemonium atrogriseum]|uniref:Serine/threonine-protein phosphatase 2A activator n=1 Tax=Phialemonium atrogriseum TaxID=1093897 RepID=A0AAJ0FR17_9PEZI|nr:serine/threonine-protein phosphatase 2A activator 2 [Phialemonium atrogriseum]KAK1769710.1 serine/threonine-protein phosphatase 2A activator 2 [Phialemonium atrogriseum]